MPKSFKKIFGPPAPPGSLEGTMGENSLTPPPDLGAGATSTQAPQETPGGVPPSTPYDQSILDTESKLNDLLGQYPMIDYQKKYSDIKQQIDARQIPKTTNPLLGFAYMMGSPQNAPGLLKDQLINAHAEQVRKETDQLNLQEKLIQGDIQQQIAKGQFGLALKQSEKLRAIEQAQKDRNRYLDFQDKLKLLNAKTEGMQKVARTKAEAMADHFNLKGKIKLAFINHALQTMTLLSTRMNPFGQEMMPFEDVWGIGLPDLIDYARQLGGVQPPSADKGGGTKSPPEDKWHKALGEVTGQTGTK